MKDKFKLRGKISSFSFVAVYITCTIAIIAQLLFGDGRLKAVFEETVVLIIAGCIFLIGVIKKGRGKIR